MKSRKLVVTRVLAYGLTAVALLGLPKKAKADIAYSLDGRNPEDNYVASISTPDNTDRSKIETGDKIRPGDIVLVSGTGKRYSNGSGNSVECYDKYMRVLEVKEGDEYAYSLGKVTHDPDNTKGNAWFKEESIFRVIIEFDNEHGYATRPLDSEEPKLGR